MKISLFTLLLFFCAFVLSAESLSSENLGSKKLSSEKKSNIHNASDSSNVTNHNIHEICESSYDLCLTLISQYLNGTAQYSRLWYAYKLYQLEALFALERVDELEAELLSIIFKKDLPEKFHIYSHILYAKILEYKGDSELALRYFNEAKNLLLAVNKDWPKPLELIKIANMLFYMKQYQIGNEMLLGLDEKFAHYTDANFKYRLYTNLGHFALNLGDHQSHIEYRVKALHWANILNNNNMQAIATYNVARSHFFIESYDTALTYFKKTIPIGNKAKNSNLVNNAYLNMADIYHRNKDKSSVKEVLKNVTSKNLGKNYAELFQRLSKDIE